MQTSNCSAKQMSEKNRNTMKYSNKMTVSTQADKSKQDGLLFAEGFSVAWETSPVLAETPFRKE